MKLDPHALHHCSRADCDHRSAYYLVFGNVTVRLCGAHALGAYHQLKQDLGLQGQ